MIVLMPNRVAMTTVSRVRFRSTTCVPPCECGVKPSPPMPASRPECMRTSVTHPAARRTWITAEIWSHGIGAPGYQDTKQRGYAALVDDARQRIQKLLVTGDNRLKQGVAPEKVRETYEEALLVAIEAGIEDDVRPLVEVRLADLERLARGSPPPDPPAA